MTYNTNRREQKDITLFDWNISSKDITLKALVYIDFKQDMN
jgi:hypothetical protein